MVRVNGTLAQQAELAALQKEQRAAFEDATYVGMNTQQQREYELRAARIAELRRALGINPGTATELW